MYALAMMGSEPVIWREKEIVMDVGVLGTTLGGFLGENVRRSGMVVSLRLLLQAQGSKGESKMCTASNEVRGIRRGTLSFVYVRTRHNGCIA